MEEQKRTIKEWLSLLGKDRDWLGKQLGVSKGTIDQWFSKPTGFPEWALKFINQLKAPSDPAAGLEVTFTAKEFELIEQARKLTGLPTRGAYYQAAINEYTDQILSAEQSASKEPASPVIQGAFKKSDSGRQKHA